MNDPIVDGIVGKLYKTEPDGPRIIVEGVCDTFIEDNGCAQYKEISPYGWVIVDALAGVGITLEDDQHPFVRIHSWDDAKQHTELHALELEDGARYRVTIEKI